MLERILFWASVVIVSWLGIRHIVSIILGWDHDGTLKPGQRLCHLTSFLLLAGSAVAAVTLQSWLPLPVGIALEYAYRHLVRWSGRLRGPT